MYLGLFFGLGLALALAPLIEVPPDVAYYAAWSRFPRLGYLDHPGAVAWALAPFPEPALLWAVRLLPALAGAAQLLLVAALLRRCGSEGVVAWTVALSPLWLAACLLWTPDTPLLLAWHGGLLILVTRRWRAALVLVAILMTASKIMGVWLTLILLIAAWRDRETRAWALVAMVASALTLMLTGLPSLAYQFARATGATPGGTGGGWYGPLVVVGGLAVLLGPGLSVAIASGIWRHRRARTPPGECVPDDRDLALSQQLVVTSLGTALPFVAVSFFVGVEANWLAPACLPLTLLAVVSRKRGDGAARWRRAAWGQAVFVLMIVTLLIGSAGGALQGHDPFRPLRGWSAWANACPSADIVVADRYQLASVLWLHRRMPGATFDAVQPNTAVRPSALDSSFHVTPADSVLVVWSERSPTASLRARLHARWPIMCRAGSIRSPQHGGAPVLAHYLVRAARPVDCASSALAP